MKKISIVVFAVLCASAVALAAVPQLIDYQGYLMESGAAVNGTKSITFKLYDAASGGSQLCSTGAQTVTVTKGVFSHSIGSTGCDLSTINWDNPVYLELTVEGTTLAPRERIAGAAYSVQTKALNVIFAPSGNLSATNAQSAIEELDAEKLAKTGGTITGSLSLTGDVTSAGTVTAATFEGDGSALTNISAGTHNHDSAYVNAGGDAMTGQLTSTVTTGTAPFVVASTTKVTNLNADALDGLDSTAFMAASADNWVNATGDAMTGALTMSASSVGSVFSSTNSGAGKSGSFISTNGTSGDSTLYVERNSTTYSQNIESWNKGEGYAFVGYSDATAGGGAGYFQTNAGSVGHGIMIKMNGNGDGLHFKHEVAGTPVMTYAHGMGATTTLIDENGAWAGATNSVLKSGDAMTGSLNMGGNNISNAGTVTAAAFDGDGSALTNIAAGTHNHDASYVNVGGDAMTGQLTSSVADGTAPFVVASTTKVTNLNADALDGLDSTAFMAATADNWVDAGGDAMTGALNMGTNDITNAGTVTAAAFDGDGSALTNIAAGTHNHDASYVNVGGDAMTGQLTSSVADGTAPFVVASTTKVTNLNADALDGLDSTAFMAATADNWVDAGGDAMTGALNMGTNDITNAGTVTAAAFDGDGSALTNIAAGTHNHDASYVNVGGDAMTGQLTSSVADGTAPFVVASTTKVTNLNADALDGLDSTAFMAATADNWVDAGGDAMTGALNMGTNDITNAGTVTAAAFDGDGSALTNISAGTHNHDASYVNVGGDTMTGQLTSSVADGTAPFVVASTTKVTNLNADALDGLDSTDFMSATADNWVDAGGDAMTGALTMNNVVINMSGANADITFDNAGGALTLAGGAITDSAGSVNINDDVDINGVIQSSLPINNVVFQHAAPGRMALNAANSAESVISWSPTGLNLAWNVWEDGVSWQNGNGAAPSANLRISNGALGTDRALEFMSALAGTPEFYSRMAITYAGKVGFGTATPSYNLHLKTGDESSVIAVDSGSGSAQLSELMFSDRGTPKWSILKDTANGFDITEESVAMGRLHILPGGNVGIGTTSPANKLDVEGSMAVGATYSGTSAAPANGLIVEGNVGVGTDAPDEKLHVQSGATTRIHVESTTASPASLWLETPASSYMWWARSASDGISLKNQNTSAQLMTIDNVGNVGIGTQTPAHKLHVDNIDASGNGAYFTTSNTGNNTGQTVYALNAGGGSSRAGRFENNNAANTACSLWANNTGGGEALCGEINNAANSSTAIKIATNGDGMAATFSLTKVDNANNAVRVTHAGVGSGDSAGIRVTTTNTAHGIDSRTTGTAGRPGKFIIENAANNNDVLFISTVGTGRLIDTNKGAYLSNTGIWTDGSSRKYKKDITPLTQDEDRKMLDVVKGIEVVRYRYKDESPDRKMTIGVIAENAPDEMTDETKEGVQPVKALGMLIAAMQAQQELIEELRREIDAFKNDAR
ncbi:MAG TPA: tail fiber domain-containing protein [bacterium]|mgnify:CR=1 FL=1|nr:tail fiber domain-containing protein [bacterium]